jgi:hypothetical protein
VSMTGEVLRRGEKYDKIPSQASESVSDHNHRPSLEEQRSPLLLTCWDWRRAMGPRFIFESVWTASARTIAMNAQCSISLPRETVASNQ